MEMMMENITRFEDLKCWQDARLLVKRIFDLARQGGLSNEYTLANQLKRGSLSVMTNIAQGFSRNHQSDLTRFLDYAQSSSQELKSLLYVVSDLDFVSKDEITELQKQCNRVRNRILRLSEYINETLDYPGKSMREEEVAYEYSSDINPEPPDEFFEDSSA